MKKIKYTQHSINRQKIRQIEKKEIEETLINPDIQIFDTLSKTKVNLRKINLTKYLAVIYLEENKYILVITSHYIKKKNIENRIKNGRWKIV